MTKHFWLTFILKHKLFVSFVQRSEHNFESPAVIVFPNTHSKNTLRESSDSPKTLITAFKIETNF